MIYYHFTNDLRFKNIKENLFAVANHLKTGEWKHSQQTLSQAKNGWYPVYEFYFGLYEGAHNVDLILSGKWNFVLGEFIKKLQFPNPKSDKHNFFQKEVNASQRIAPLRTLIKLLFHTYENGEGQGISVENFKKYILANEDVAQNKLSISELYRQMEDGVATHDYHNTVELSGGDSERFVTQLLGAIEPLDYINVESGYVKLIYDKLLTEDKAILLDIITYDEFWDIDSQLEKNKLIGSYKEYLQSEESLSYQELPVQNDDSEDNSRISGGENILFYGVPGSGKSYAIEKEYGNQRMDRVVFHPDYMSTDFIGQILPTIKADGTISYEFKPGPFTKIMEKAYKDPSNMYYLVIEEINRGNAPAIFGEIFQLLDRSETGESKYSVVNYDVSRVVYGDDSIQIKLPSNLTLLATMNTSDQNVFTLDTAFQRRWNMRMILNDISKAEHKDEVIADSSVTWGTFNEVINALILSSNANMLSSEDKRLGAYFISPIDLRYHDDIERRFSEKVIKYLWDDAFKFSRDKLFDTTNLKSLEDVIITFLSESGNKRFVIFKEDVMNILISKSSTSSSYESVEEGTSESETEVAEND